MPILYNEGIGTGVSLEEWSFRTIVCRPPTLLGVKVLGLISRGIQVDVTGADSIQRVMQNILENEGQINALVDSAGFAKHAYGENLTDSGFAQLLNEHLGGTLGVCRAALSRTPAERQTAEGAAFVNLFRGRGEWDPRAA